MESDFSNAQGCKLDKSGFRRTCFPRNLRIAFFETFQNSLVNKFAIIK